ncbi:MAG: hypothetical protein IPM47_20735 [Sphingobacteriales bacterium]|nr:MAG: hypothetical protein IPM47_20735 [Sphingobacteriales bacterium]
MKTLLRHNATVLFFMVLSIWCLSLQARAQDNSENQEKIKSMQAMFFNEQLNLTPEEAKNFWPLYYQYREEIKSINQKLRNLESENLSPEQKLAKKNQLEEQKLAISKKYQDQFKKVLPVAKVAQIDKVERDFKMWLLEQFKQRP